MLYFEGLADISSAAFLFTRALKTFCSVVLLSGSWLCSRDPDKILVPSISVLSFAWHFFVLAEHRHKIWHFNSLLILYVYQSTMMQGSLISVSVLVISRSIVLRIIYEIDKTDKII